MKFLGIDPGSSGGFCCIDEKLNVLHMQSMPQSDGEISIMMDVRDIVQGIEPDYVALEKVWGRGGNGANSNFAFGRSYDAIIAALNDLYIQFENPTPQSWQKLCRIDDDYVWDTSGKRRKNITKETSLNAANRIFNIQEEVFWLGSTRQRTNKDGIYDAAQIAYWLLQSTDLQLLG